MECTQRQECTQDAYSTYSERFCPEQIGFLGICGAKHAIKKGPNKIGRDPQTCSIVLNDNSISRQHAVINILNKKDFMLMDLDSSNKTKLLDKILQPYIPNALKNGDTVQFGQVFGIFRLLEEDDDLPMTQAVEIPDTPVFTRHVSRLKTAPITTVPESPDVSDRDESVIAQSPKKKPDLKSTNNNLIKSLGKIVCTQKIETNKINNVYWTSSKKSDSFNSTFENNSSYTISTSKSPKKLTIESSIYDMETQAPALPDINQKSDSIYEANTQVSTNQTLQTSNSCDTEVSHIEMLPEVFKVSDQSNVQLNLFVTNEKFNIFEAETQIMVQDKERKTDPTPLNAIITDKECDIVSDINKKLNSSDEEICFDEIDCQQFEDEECGSQPLLSSDPDYLKNLVPPVTSPEKSEDNNIKNTTTTSAVLNDSDSRNSEEIAPSQTVTEKPIEDDVTDCEDNMLELAVNISNQPNKIHIDDDVTDCEDDLINVKLNCKQKVTREDDDLTDCEEDVIEISQNRSKISNLVPGFDDLPTQVIGEENHVVGKNHESEKDDVPFEDMLTQVIEECPVESNLVPSVAKNTDKLIPTNNLQTRVNDNVIPQEQSSSTVRQFGKNDHFKQPLSPLSLKKREVTSLKSSNSATVVIKVSNVPSEVENDQNYYDATQQILDDLSTQSELNNVSESKIENHNLATGRNTLTKKTLSEVVPLGKNRSSDGSDLEVTPKKFNPSKFLMIDLPNSQEIKSCDFVSSKIDDTDSSDGFEDTEEQDNNKHSPRTSKKRRKKDIKLDLMKKFDSKTLPTRAITRIRKPNRKILDGDSTTKNMVEKILQSNLGLDKKHEVDGEIIQLNLKRLRSKMEKAINKPSSSGRKSEKDEKNVAPKHVQLQQNLRKSDEKVSRERRLPQSTEKELKQQSIKSMFKEPSSEDIVAAEACRILKTEPIDSAHKRRCSSRNKKKEDKKDVLESKINEVTSESRERKNPNSRPHSSRNEVKETIDLTIEPETTVRRSRRHKTTKNKIDDKKEKMLKMKESHKLKNIPVVIPENNEHSTVYNLSSETAVDSPTNLKRQATSDIFPSKIKKSKSSNTVNASVRATSLRGVRTQYVLFTAFPCEEVKLKLEKLGAVVVSDVKSCTVVLTLQIRRTFKLLCAMGLGKPIVGPNWVQACADSNMIVDPWLYLMKDEATEKRFGFNLRQSLTCKRNFLKGYNVFCTPNVTPNAQEMKSIVECSGGTWKEGGRSWFCVSCPADKALWPALRKRGAILVSTEFILGGVLQQRINLDRDKLG